MGNYNSINDPLILLLFLVVFLTKSTNINSGANNNHNSLLKKW